MKPMFEPRGYRGMLNFLRSRQAYKPSETLGELLEELALGPDGVPPDSVREHLNDAVKTAYAEPRNRSQGWILTEED